jgi:hypothetical protein
MRSPHAKDVINWVMQNRNGGLNYDGKRPVTTTNTSLGRSSSQKSMRAHGGGARSPSPTHRKSNNGSFLSEVEGFDRNLIHDDSFIIDVFHPSSRRNSSSSRRSSKGTNVVSHTNNGSGAAKEARRGSSSTAVVTESELRRMVKAAAETRTRSSNNSPPGKATADISVNTSSFDLSAANTSIDTSDPSHSISLVEENSNLRKLVFEQKELLMKAREKIGQLTNYIDSLNMSLSVSGINIGRDDEL